MESWVQESHDRSGSERGQHDKQGRMEEGANQLYRRHKKTGKAREEEERKGKKGETLLITVELRIWDMCDI